MRSLTIGAKMKEKKIEKLKYYYDGRRLKANRFFKNDNPCRCTK